MQKLFGWWGEWKNSTMLSVTQDWNSWKVCWVSWCCTNLKHTLDETQRTHLQKVYLMTALCKDHVLSRSSVVADMTGLRPVTSSFHAPDESSAECMLGGAPVFIDGFSGLMGKNEWTKRIKQTEKMMYECWAADHKSELRSGVDPD